MPCHLPLHKGGVWPGHTLRLPLTFCLPGDIVSPSKWRGRRRAEISSCPERDVFGASILQLPSAVPLPSCPGHDRDGTLPLQRTQATRLMCKHWHTSVSCSHPSQRPTAPHSAENAAGLRPTCFSVCVCRCCPAPGCYALLLVSRVEPWSISAWNRREQHGWTGARAKNKICWQICFLPESEGSRASRTGAA